MVLLSLLLCGCRARGPVVSLPLMPQLMRAARWPMHKLRPHYARPSVCLSVWALPGCPAASIPRLCASNLGRPNESPPIQATHHRHDYGEAGPA